ncbi:hypothetical protein A9G35_05475 [Gilliamella sp. Choc5-1]|uniref:hypothetical protein n=1 Tax=Gilliamella sp. Choc5-1 TaxID=3120238 RepID=UPI00080E96F5|nr:hypothetical protein [Gilliamella apicola]OCG46330.1 hypothetical protein A9G35_05475 [Gilliamella apicola]
MSQIDLNGQTLSTHRWQEGNEIARSMGRFGELNCHQQFDNRGRLLNYINPRFKTAGIGMATHFQTKKLRGKCFLNSTGGK